MRLGTGARRNRYLPLDLLISALLARCISIFLRAFHIGHGSTLPGRLSSFLNRRLWERLAGIPGLQLILVTGTNGKTTTVHILRHLLRSSGLAAESNVSGANLESGLMTAILTRLSLRRPGVEPFFFVLEVDEAALVPLADRLHPRAVAVTNLSRDQLDRYGELDTVVRRMNGALSKFGEDTIIALNADDPSVAKLGTGHPAAVFFGLEGEIEVVDYSPVLEHHVCAACGEGLAYHRFYLGHYGDWYCPSCGLVRPRRLASAAAVTREGGMSFLLRLEGEEVRVRLPLPGLHNIYNALAAAAVAYSLGLSPGKIAASLGTVTPCFGRGERQRLGRRELRLFLIKNPVGACTILSTLAHDRVKQIWFVINDHPADGRDVSWLWDVDFEGFLEWNGLPERVIVSGRRTLDMAVRLRYAGLPPDLLEVEPRIGRVLRRLGKEPADGACQVLVNYTALLDLRERLRKAYRW